MSRARRWPAYVLLFAPACSTPPSPAANGSALPASSTGAPGELSADLQAAVDKIGRSGPVASAVKPIVESKDPLALERATDRLIEHGEFVASEIWIPTQRDFMRRVNRERKVEPTAEEFEAQMLLYQAEEHARVVEAMSEVGGARVVEYAVALTKRTDTHATLWRAAVALLERHAPNHPELAAIRNAPEGSLTPSVPGAGATVEGMRPGFLECFKTELAKDAKYQRDNARLTLRLGAKGEITSISTSGTTRPAFIRCLEDVARRAKFDPPGRGVGATVVIPLSFTRE